MKTTPEKIAQLRRLHADSTMVAGPHYRKAACEELPGLMDDLEAAQKREQVLLAERERLREAMTGLLEYVPSDAQLVDAALIVATDTPRNRALLKALAALEAR